MKKTVITALAAVAICASSALANDDTSKTYREFFHRYDTEPVSKRVYEMFVIGVEQGLLAANTALASSGQKVLYCQPEHVTHKPKQIFCNLRTIVEHFKMLDMKPEGKALLILKALQMKYPCKKTVSR